MNPIELCVWRLRDATINFLPVLFAALIGWRLRDATIDFLPVLFAALSGWRLRYATIDFIPVLFALLIGQKFLDRVAREDVDKPSWQMCLKKSESRNIHALISATLSLDPNL